MKALKLVLIVAGAAMLVGGTAFAMLTFGFVSVEFPATAQPGESITITATVDRELKDIKLVQDDGRVIASKWWHVQYPSVYPDFPQVAPNTYSVTLTMPNSDYHLSLGAEAVDGTVAREGFFIYLPTPPEPVVPPTEPPVLPPEPPYQPPEPFDTNNTLTKVVLMLGGLGLIFVGWKFA